jgi:hypothetical protein
VHNIEVMVYNNVSQQNATLTIIVTKEDSCQPPTVQIPGWQEIKVHLDIIYFNTFDDYL